MTFRIFTNDRGKVAGVPKYSCLCEVEAATAQEALSNVNQNLKGLGPPQFAPIKAIQWPPTTDRHKAWLANYT